MNIREADRVRACLDCGGPSALHPAAVVTYSEEPSPETGHVGWMWWALGAVGDAPTYEAACAAAVAEIQRRIDDRMTIL